MYLPWASSFKYLGHTKMSVRLEGDQGQDAFSISWSYQILAWAGPRITYTYRAEASSNFRRLLRNDSIAASIITYLHLLRHLGMIIHDLAWETFGVCYRSKDGGSPPCEQRAAIPLTCGPLRPTAEPFSWEHDSSLNDKAIVLKKVRHDHGTIRYIDMPEYSLRGFEELSLRFPGQLWWLLRYLLFFSVVHRGLGYGVCPLQPVLPVRHPYR